MGSTGKRLERTGIYYDEYEGVAPSNAGRDREPGLVDYFVSRPHPERNGGDNEADAKVDVPLIAIDDQMAIEVSGGEVEVVCEGE
jgi:hypothetical protein